MSIKYTKQIAYFDDCYKNFLAIAKNSTCDADVKSMIVELCEQTKKIKSKMEFYDDLATNSMGVGSESASATKNDISSKNEIEIKKLMARSTENSIKKENPNKNKNKKMHQGKNFLYIRKEYHEWKYLSSTSIKGIKNKEDFDRIPFVFTPDVIFVLNNNHYDECYIGKDHYLYMVQNNHLVKYIKNDVQQMWGYGKLKYKNGKPYIDKYTEYISDSDSDIAIDESDED
jgi:hypothetical protein